MVSTDSAPQSIWEGSFLTMFEWSAENEYSHRVGEEASTFFGKTVYYSIFSYGPKSEDLDEDEKIGTDENNNLRNTQNYNFTGPISDSQDVWDVEDLPVSVDKYMDGGSVWHEGQNDLIIATTTSISQTIAGITFDLTGAPDGEVQLAQLILTKYTDNANGGGIVDLAVWDEDWTTADGWAVGNMLPDMMTKNNQDLDIPSGPDDVITVDVTNTYENWLSGSYNNYGFSLRSTDGDNSFPFVASEGGANGPILRVYYMH